VVQERLDGAAIKSHGDAIHHPMLSSEVIRPVSLREIQMEQKVQEGVPILRKVPVGVDNPDCMEIVEGGKMRPQHTTRTVYFASSKRGKTARNRLLIYILIPGYFYFIL
jgi:hypothetical protein